MIRAMTSGRGIRIDGGYAPPYINMDAQSAGTMRYNNCVEVYNGSSWIPVSTHAQVQLDDETYMVIEWAKQKMAEDLKIKALAEKYPAVKDLQGQLDLVLAIVRDYKEDQTV